MPFQSVVCKLGNMRKAQEWVLYPWKEGPLIIQCDGRIASINLDTGKATLSDGKGGHQGFIKLGLDFGAKIVDVPQNVMNDIKSKLSS
jgi:hypothetical protein